MIKKFMAADNLAKVLENPENEVVTSITATTADAYETSKEAAEHVEEVITELEKVAEPVVTEHEEAPEVKQDSIYTKKLTLDEAVEDFKIKEAPAKAEKITAEDYLSFDMYDFIYNMVTSSQIEPSVKIPVHFDHPMRRFNYAGADDYTSTNSNVGQPQVSSDYDGNIVLYNDDPDYFNDVKAVCDAYNIKYSAVQPSKNKDSYWKYNMTVFVPALSTGYPMMAADFFADQGLALSDVLEKVGAGEGKVNDWAAKYDKHVNKDAKELDKMINDNSVEQIFEKHVHLAGRSNDPLEGFLKELYKELDSKSLSYSKRAVKTRFMAEFDDDFED